jgi:spermidine synthase
MANMSYCMFENTYGDLKDCVTRLEEDGYEAVERESSWYERGAMEAMLMLCKRYIKAMEDVPAAVDEDFSPWD